MIHAEPAAIEPASDAERFGDIWRRIVCERAQRAAAAIAAGTATAAQAARDTHLCGLIDSAIARDFAAPLPGTTADGDRPMAALADHVAASLLLRTIALRANMRGEPHALRLTLLSIRFGHMLTQAQDAIWSLYRLEQDGWNNPNWQRGSIPHPRWPAEPAQPQRTA